MLNVVGIWFTVTAGVTVNTLVQPATLAVRVYIPASLPDSVAAVILAVVIDDGLLISPVAGPVQAYVGVPCPPVAVAVIVNAVPIHAGLADSTTGMLVGSLFTVSVGVTVKAVVQPGADTVSVYIPWSPVATVVMPVEPFVAPGFTIVLAPPVQAYVTPAVVPVITAPKLTELPAHTGVALTLGTIDVGILFTVIVVPLVAVHEPFVATTLYTLAPVAPGVMVGLEHAVQLRPVAPPIPLHVNDPDATAVLV